MLGPVGRRTVPSGMAMPSPPNRAARQVRAATVEYVCSAVSTDTTLRYREADLDSEVHRSRLPAAMPVFGTLRAATAN